MTIVEFKDLMIGIASIFTIIGVVAAVIVYIKNSNSEKRKRCIDNAARYLAEHEKLFCESSYLLCVLREMEKGTYKRDLNNEELEKKFNRFLGGMEHLAILQNARAIPRSINAYMLGWFCKHIYPVLTDSEKSNKYWELAVEFIEDTKNAAEEYEKLDKEKRFGYLSKNHFNT